MNTHDGEPAMIPSVPAWPFVLPTRKVITQEDLTCFMESDIRMALLNFIGQLSEAVKGLKLSHAVQENEIIHRILDMLDAVEEIVVNTPPEENSNSRFGNPAFRLFYDRAQLKVPEMLATFIPIPDAIPEVAKYVEKCFGDRRRIDYGTGHEAHFICFLYCLVQLHLVSSTDYPALVLRVFVRYIKVMRRIQSTYWLEPAGSHGVWGLDDYHSLPFLFGASQLATHPFLRPKSIHDAEVLVHFADEYLYLDCLRALQHAKSVSLRWHSPMLDDISAVKSWAKVEAGMRKMYAAEVLGKLPILQHLLFGSLIAFTGPSGKSVSDADLETSALDGHLHTYAMGQAFPTCCGMRIPSTHAALQAAALQSAQRNPVLPFD